MFQLILENCTCYLSKKHIYVDVTAKSIHLNVFFFSVVGCQDCTKVGSASKL